MIEGLDLDPEDLYLPYVVRAKDPKAAAAADRAAGAPSTIGIGPVLVKLPPHVIEALRAAETQAEHSRHCQCRVKHPVRITATARICTGCRRERI